MSLETGSIVEGKVTSIAKFGVFVLLPEGKSGLVHISEIANSFVSDISQFVSVGQSVKVRILSISDEGKINLSIKRAEEQSASAPQRQPRRQESEHRPPARVAFAAEEPAPKTDDRDFEDKLKKFMQESDSRIADNRLYSDHPRRNRKR